MLRSHHHLRGFVKLALWDVYCVNGYGSFRLGYVCVGFGGNCDCRYGILYAPTLGGGFCGFGYSDDDEISTSPRGLDSLAKKL